LPKLSGCGESDSWITANLVLTLLAALTTVACMLLRFRAYARTRVGLLLWSALCFVFLGLNNVLLFFDDLGGDHRQERAAPPRLRRR
jgi:uncharacterized protein DUF5985